MRISVFLLSLVSPLALSGAVALAQPAASPTPITPRVSCGALLQTGASGISPGVPDFSRIPGAPARITSAVVVEKTADQDAYCNVGGYLAGQIQFSLHLPLNTYQGRYLQTGCGGFCGVVRPPVSPPCTVQPGGQFATASTNNGHTSAAVFDGLWASSRDAREDFAHRAVHQLAVASKSIITAFYGAAPHHSYFQGCSEGGREALTEAQRYPSDFDGIIAGAPALITAPMAGELFPWLARVNLDAAGKPILSAAKLPALHQQVVKSCDLIDGTQDGLLADPIRCTFDPIQTLCPAGEDIPTCLTPAEVKVVQGIYQGPVTAQGERLYPGGLQRGSELSWTGIIVPIPGVPAHVPTLMQQAADNFLRFIAFDPGDSGLDSHTWTFDRAGFESLKRWGKRFNATQTDLSAFQRRGGKLVLWHGWSDQIIPPTGTLEYVGAVQRRMGTDRTSSFLRLFMVPGMYHCIDAQPRNRWGEGPSEFDALSGLAAWVEQGKPMDTLQVTQTVDGQATRSQVLTAHQTQEPPVNWLGADLF